MKGINRFALLVSILVAGNLILAGYVFAGKPVGGTTVSFGITAPKTKIGDAIGHPTYGGGFHNIAIHGNEIYTAYTNSIQALGNEVCVGRSFDGGLFWRRSMCIAQGSDIDTNGASIAIGPDPANPGQTIIHVVWGERDATVGGYINYSRGLLANGPAYPDVRIWDPQRVVSGDINPAPWRRAIAADNNGGVHIVFNGRDSGNYYTHSNDGGATFIETATLIGYGIGEPSIDVDNVGNVYVSWNDNLYLYMSKKPAGSSQWNPPVRVNGNIPPGYSSIAAFDSNRIYIAWKGTGVNVAYTTNGGNQPGDWTQKLVSSLGEDPSIVVDKNGVISVAWDGSDSTGWHVYFSRSTNGGATWQTPRSVLDTISYGFPNLAVDDLNKACIFFGDDAESAVYFTKEK